ncbi:hypothetical protein D5F01_LYC21733 [Larimichthys crocea]|uniref:TBC1 domain-containing protein n=1 Tax=Larimichthys crocea TaxID=215358 RepID=A0A6G0HKB9_LARCR|nr:hypothetical protein D5F01_LYC21733 [Larimichthys crocea]
MSCSCCCWVTPSGEPLEGIRKKERLVGGEEEEEEEEEGSRRRRRRQEEEEEQEEEAGGQAEDSRRNMDISLLREQYRCTRDRQKRHTQVLLFRTVSEELSEAVSIIPVTQGLTSPWEPSGSTPPAISFDSDPMTYDPWHIHLGLHRRCCLGVTAQLTASSPETTNTNGSSRRSSTSSEADDSTFDSPGSSFNCPTDHSNTDRSREDPDTGSLEEVGPVQVPVCGPLHPTEQTPSDGSQEDHPDGSFTDSQECTGASSDESSTPVASVTCSPSSSITSLHVDLKENQSAGRKTSNAVLQDSSTLVWRGSRKFSSPALRFTRQLTLGGVGSSLGVHQNQNYHPFPNRKAPRISEAARRLGMYSSF